MNSELSKPSQQLLTAILILLSAPVLYKLYETFFLEGRFSVTQINPETIWTFLQLAASIFFVVLLALRKFGILLFLIAHAVTQFIQMLFRLPHFDTLLFKFWVFQLINIAALILMILLLQRENNRFFNLELNAKPSGFKKTYRLMLAFIVVFLVTQTAEIILSISLNYDLQLTNFFNSYTVLFLLIMVLTIIGVVQKTKIMNLTFFMVSAVTVDSFFYSGNLILAPFTENWNGDAMFYIGYAIALDILFLTYGILGLLIIRSYFREKAGSENQSEQPEILDAF